MTEWTKSQQLESKYYQCSFCKREIASVKGFELNNHSQSIYLCPHCDKPTMFLGGGQIPGVRYGDNVNDISDAMVSFLYDEARLAAGNGIYTSAVMCCRKLLMHIAVEKGAEIGKPFVYYVEYLASKNYVPPGAEGWVDHIRKKGNEANHEIVIMTKEDAEDLLNFLGMLLKFIYEFPARLKTKQPNP